MINSQNAPGISTTNSNQFRQGEKIRITSYYDNWHLNRFKRKLYANLWEAGSRKATECIHPLKMQEDLLNIGQWE